MKRTLSLLFIAVALTTRLSGQGTILWDESVNGPLSNGGGGQTPLGHCQLGTNSILGATEYIPNGIYGDYFTFSISSLTEISVLRLAATKPVAVWLGTADFGTEYGYVINPVSGDILPQWGLASMGAGVYGMYIKNYDFDSGASIANYRFDFVVQVIPEPGVLWLLLGGLSSAGFYRWRKAH